MEWRGIIFSRNLVGQEAWSGCGAWRVVEDEMEGQSDCQELCMPIVEFGPHTVGERQPVKDLRQRWLSKFLRGFTSSLGIRFVKRWS